MGIQHQHFNHPVVCIGTGRGGRFGDSVWQVGNLPHDFAAGDVNLCKATWPAVAASSWLFSVLPQCCFHRHPCRLAVRCDGQAFQCFVDARTGQQPKVKHRRQGKSTHQRPVKPRLLQAGRRASHRVAFAGPQQALAGRMPANCFRVRRAHALQKRHASQFNIAEFLKGQSNPRRVKTRRADATAVITQQVIGTTGRVMVNTRQTAHGGALVLQLVRQARLANQAQPGRGCRRLAPCIAS